MNTTKRQISGLLIVVGNSLTGIGCIGLVLALSGLIEAIGLFEIKRQGQIVWVREEKKARVAKKT